MYEGKEAESERKKTNVQMTYFVDGIRAQLRLSLLVLVPFHLSQRLLEGLRGASDYRSQDDNAKKKKKDNRLRE